MSANIVVVGAGVSGLTSALLLSKKHNVTVIAKHMPGDYDIEYTSPWAGANFMPMGNENTSEAGWEKDTWPELARLAKEVPEAGIHFQNTVAFSRKKDADSTTGKWLATLFAKSPWFKEVVPDFRITSENLPEGIDSRTDFTSICIDTMVYLPYLKGQCFKQGVTFKRGVVSHISDAASLHHSGKKADVIINCTGLLARKLGGVMDLNVVPVRGQVVVVRNDPGDHMFTISGTDDGDGENCYIMKRAGGGGTILGGTYMKGNWESQPDPNIALRIMKRAVEICPALTNGKGIEALDVIRHGVGLRPVREGGLRLEKERIGQSWVVHNYGHGAWGYQGSYGSSQDVVKLVEEVLSAKAKL